MDLSIRLCYIIIVVDSGVWLSLVERFVRDEEVARSNRVTPTMYAPVIRTGAFVFQIITGFLI